MREYPTASSHVETSTPGEYHPAAQGVAVDKWGDFIARVGIPAAIAVLVLWRLDESLRELTKAIHGLAQLIVTHEATSQAVYELLRRVVN
jgi:hypothetical protein